MKNEPLCHAPCPIARSLGRIGDSWSIMILRDAFAGFTRFDEFQKSSNVAPNILSRRLKALVDDGLLEKVCYSSTPPRYEYHLTPRGRDFRMVLLALAEWGNRHFAPEGRQMQLVEMATQRHVEPLMVDKATGEEIIPGKYAMVPGPAASPLMKYRHEYLLRKREGDSGQKFQPEPYRDASNESDQ
ncbi:TPA: helix-turn-helix transcriptional regulator [Klebsiella pneumoniae]|uniref:winged helix-turn-helix transcriptional regulator n=1 Tax=Klebsiella pneumoniae TaxID=573 RepID=UPI000E2D15D3|nr:helix-turn-helix domain-containing protein [Klebsiella pneumoniae]HBQ5773248.1 helix-turn-helix transcriptional regulator [Klebsiella pneumoniae subsp. pneumoniae]MDP1219354.1 helix-turn-helix domain-containing protein [Klebsiella pneumoniae]MEC4453161.1 helix-turn-helix domain-containing protein [Klebsiella pneumoniae]QJN33299.1 helix-turn-helix transcriptional regulator [Klebsiella pneumoniae]QJN65708.1 helix-turn-helix transcriptional regulator [Klebsiella pneumoniae]